MFVKVMYSNILVFMNVAYLDTVHKHDLIAETAKQSVLCNLSPLVAY